MEVIDSDALPPSLVLAPLHILIQQDVPAMTLCLVDDILLELPLQWGRVHPLQLVGLMDGADHSLGAADRLFTNEVGTSCKLIQRTLIWTMLPPLSLPL